MRNRSSSDRGWGCDGNLLTNLEGAFHGNPGSSTARYSGPGPQPDIADVCCVPLIGKVRKADGATTSNLKN